LGLSTETSSATPKTDDAVRTALKLQIKEQNTFPSRTSRGICTCYTVSVQSIMNHTKVYIMAGIPMTDRPSHYKSYKNSTDPDSSPTTNMPAVPRGSAYRAHGTSHRMYLPPHHTLLCSAIGDKTAQLWRKV